MFGWSLNKNTPKDIYWENPLKKEVNIEPIFKFIKEDNKTRVINEKVNFLFDHFSKIQIIEGYKRIYYRLNFNFTPFEYKGKTYELSNDEKEEIEQASILGILYYFNANRKKIKVRRSDFKWSQTINKTRFLLENKFSDNQRDLKLKFGAYINRMSYKEYKKIIESQERFESMF